MTLEDDEQNARDRYARQRVNAKIQYRMLWQKYDLADVLRTIDEEENAFISTLRSVSGLDEEKNANTISGTQKRGLTEPKGRGQDFNSWAKGREPWNKGKKYTHKKDSNRGDGEGLTNNDDYREDE
jgi:hypothetical protein